MRKYIYADESGNFDFRVRTGASKYFIVTTVMLQDHKVASELFDLRRNLAWKGFNLRTGFHAAEDSQAVRNEVFGILQPHDFRVDATIMEKRKAQPQLRPSAIRFYQHGWLYHMRYIAPKVATSQDEVLVVAAAVATKKRAASFNNAVKDVMSQISPANALKSVPWPAATDPCLQIADYCSWAIQRKWERGDDRSYSLIKSKVKSEYDLFERGNTYYY